MATENEVHTLWSCTTSRFQVPPPHILFFQVSALSMMGSRLDESVGCGRAVSRGFVTEKGQPASQTAKREAKERVNKERGEAGCVHAEGATGARVLDEAEEDDGYAWQEKSKVAAAQRPALFCIERPFCQKALRPALSSIPPLHALKTAEDDDRTKDQGVHVSLVSARLTRVGLT